MKSVIFLLSFLFSLSVSWSQSPTPTPAPSPPTPAETSWNVTEGNITCIKADFKIRFKISVGNETRYLVLPPTADSSRSSCDVSNVTQILSLRSENEFDLVFTFEKDSEKTYVKNVTLELLSPEEPGSFYNDSKLFSVQNDYSYWCKSLTSVPMQNATMEIFEMHIQAFGGTGKDFAIAERCPADDTISDIVPIVVACALAALIIVVLIAYLIGRRRSRQKGYNSV
ncbi:lysosome-associated membrane glycoprotein 1 [Parasteatoda tepidariorum]|uniref:lysosome-associated membrane glycoprotein 1 n=1 Tax=Parasteatoda tepidariorum TaxID=114398 RepID=UPI00077FB510|nr:lysosome-associated membrane glycoprotein 1 [Parasteatoda tepidariorum]XP_015929027.1 lysosome-associated membrane glycoprotein 1 [Parasteatoda tepidariorum]